jgi:hypothetical protein
LRHREKEESTKRRQQARIKNFINFIQLVRKLLNFNAAIFFLRITL